MGLLGNKSTTLIPESQRQEYWDECRDYIEKYALWKMGEWPWSLPIPAKNNPHEYYTWQFYCSKVTMNYDINHKLSVLALDALLPVWKKKKFQLAGLETDGVPLVTGMLYTAQAFDVYNGLTGFRVRKEYKEYGLKNLIEGRVVSRRPALMVDDLVSSKETAYVAWDRMKNKEKMKVSNHMFALINKLLKSEADGTDTPKNAITGAPLLDDSIAYNVKAVCLYHLDDFSVGKERKDLEQFVSTNINSIS